MSRITISDLAIDSNSFINEVDETEAAFVNGGYNPLLVGAFIEGYGLLVEKIVKVLAKTYLKALKLLLKAK
ncbi:hypothetical protein H6G41_06975 [Tolypothrix sp. FACHB-123]|uniref:hypothetical protein n=1 Tax=Tolypothrix sp. FACHB-123 TaxID=2692868 RepID=UPI001684FA0B|nr:hypothetical protein [Tolypothrix sp. FACHB-123]MBD2354372.1 hypothetical protein [Tolypothrix sp. FACHB-123]